MNIENSEKIENNNFTHSRNGSKASLIENSDNDFNKIYTHSRNTSKSSLTDIGKNSHTRNGSKSSITNITNMIGKRIGTFGRPVKINDRGSSLQKNNLDSHIHKSSYSNLRNNTTSDFLISTRESSLLYNNSSNIISNSNSTSSTANTSKDHSVPYSSHSRENLNYLYHFSKISPSSSSPRDVNVQTNSPLSGYKNVLTENQNISNNSYLSKSGNLNIHYSPTSTTPVSPIYPNRENYYNQKENKYNNFHNSPTSSKGKLIFIK